MKLTLNDIPRELNQNNIDLAIANYLELINDVPIKLEADNILNYLKKIKRENINSGPYPDVTLFEAANRIMTDLTILFGVKELLNQKDKDISFKEFKVEFGHENSNAHDIEAEQDGRILIGEAFNVAESFFQGKKARSLKKLRNSKSKSTHILLLYNSDAVSPNYKPIKIHNEIHFPVKIDFNFRKHFKG